MKVQASIKTLEMTYEEWKAARMKGIGGSDAAAAIGVSRWKSPLQLYLEKSGEIEQPEAGEAAYWGNVLEAVVADEFTKLIVTQQAYSANTRVITTSNQMVQDLLNMLR